MSMSKEPDSVMALDPQQRKRRNALLFVAHLLVAVALFGYYIWSTAHNGGG